MSADTGTETAAVIRAMTSAAFLAPSPAASGTPSDQAAPALVVAIAFAPAASIATAEATSQAFASSNGAPAWCRLAKTSALRICIGNTFRTRTGTGARADGTLDLKGDHQFVIDLDEFDDPLRELAGDQVLICSRTGMSVVGRLVREVLDEQQVVRLRRVAIHPERQGSWLGPRSLRRELLHDRFGLGLHAVFQLDRKYLHQHRDLLRQRLALPPLSLAARTARSLATSGHLHPDRRPNMAGVLSGPSRIPRT